MIPKPGLAIHFLSLCPLSFPTFSDLTLLQEACATSPEAMYLSPRIPVTDMAGWPQGQCIFFFFFEGSVSSGLYLHNLAHSGVLTLLQSEPAGTELWLPQGA